MRCQMGSLAIVAFVAAKAFAFVARVAPQSVYRSHAIVASSNTLEMKVFDWKRRSADESALVRVDSQEFRVDNIRGAPGSRKRKTRKGRGIAAGQGATCGKGMRGQLSRSGRPARPGFEGGQMPLYRRLPKYVGRAMGPGHRREIYSVIRLDQLESAQANSEVDYKTLLVSGAVTKAKHSIIKVVGSKAEGIEVPPGLTVKAHAFTASAKAAIEKAGGSCVYLNKNTGDVLDTVDA